MLALLVAVALTQTPQHRLFQQPNLPRQSAPSYAFFEFAPADGAGMTAPCACTTPTGAKGEAMTFTRASSGTCLKGGTTTGIADGDMVTCSSNQPRVMPGGDGTGGVGLLVEGARTNSCLRSEEIDNAAWTPQNSGSAAPIITANAAIAPDGTTTAERVQIAACPTGGNYSLVQSSGSAQTTAAGSIFVKGVSGSGNLGLAIVSTGGPNGFLSCAFVSSSWTRCSLAATGAAATTSLYFGCGNGVVGMTSTGAADVYVWGGQLEAGAFASSYIATAGATVTRAAEAATFPGATWPVSPVSVAATVVVPWSGTATAGDLLYGNVASNSGWGFGWTGGGILRTQPCAAGSCSTLDVAQGPTASVASRWAFSYSGTDTTIYKDAAAIAGPTAKTAAASPWATATGLASGGFGPLNGVIKRVCLDPSPTRCR